MSKNKEIFDRINFLYQAAHYTIGLGEHELTRFYINTMLKMSTRNVLKLDPSIKRTICSKCNVPLIPGLTAKVRIKAKRERHQVWTCTQCGFVKRYLSRANFTLWSETPEALKPLDVSQSTHTKKKKCQN